MAGSIQPHFVLDISVNECRDVDRAGKRPPVRDDQRFLAARQQAVCRRADWLAMACLARARPSRVDPATTTRPVVRFQKISRSRFASIFDLSMPGTFIKSVHILNGPFVPR